MCAIWMDDNTPFVVAVPLYIYLFRREGLQPTCSKLYVGVFVYESISLPCTVIVYASLGVTMLNIISVLESLGSSSEQLKV